mgnify:CR=1 FL=1
MLFRVVFALGVAVGAGFLAYRVPGLEVELFGEQARGLFVLHSAALPLLLLLFVSWAEEARAAIRITVVGVGIGGSAGTVVRLAQELFSEEPVVWFPLVEPVLPDSLWDERIWLVLNATIALIITIAIFNSGGDGPEQDEQTPPPPSANGQNAEGEGTERPPSPFGPQDEWSPDH